MKHHTIISIAAGLLVAGGANAACEYPSRVDIPNGSQASKEEMMAGQKAVKSYMASMNEYLDCIEIETEAAKSADEDAAVTAERDALLAKRYNAAVDEMETLAESFNVEVREYKAQGQ
ncbi:MAG: hypothetical protein AAF004_03400 [Pseudomonadota bacterium]